VRVEVEKFQFLIGRLKTGPPGAYPGRKEGFQFLIGRLKTGNCWGPIPLADGFNSS